MVSGTQEFNQVFGKTLEDAPYLAQTAYKYFTQGETLLIVRAGDSRDPELYPQAAQYASKKIRLGERDVAASSGYQTFTRSTALAAGTFAPGASFGFKVTADHRAFIEPKTVETWDAVMHETSNNTGNPSPAIELDVVTKIAYNSPSDKSFEVNYKEHDITASATNQKAGQGTRTGTAFGDTVTSTVYNYASNDTFSDDRSNYVYMTGTHGAVALGSVDMQNGFDFASTNQDLQIELENELYVVTLDLGTASAEDVVNHINTKLATAVNLASANMTDLSSDFEAFHVTPKQDGTTHVGLRRIGRVVASAGSTGFTISLSDAASTLGITQGEYLDSDYVFGSYHGEDSLGNIFDGQVVLMKSGAPESDIESFEEPIDISLTAPSSGDWQLSDIVSQINTGLTAGHSGYPTNPARATALSLDGVSGKVMLKTNISASEGSRSIVRIGNTTANSFIELVGVDMPTDGEQERPVGESVITLRAAEKGSYGNKLVLRTEKKQVQTGPNSVEDYYNVYVLFDGKEVSVYQRVSWDDQTSEKFLPALLEEDLYINMEAEDEDGNLVLEKLPDGDWWLGNDELPEGVSSLVANVIDFTVGSNGWTEDSEGVISEMDDDLIKALEKIYNPEVYDFNLVAAPGSASKKVQKAIQDICESRKDCFGVIDGAPFGIGLGVKEGLNHVSEVNTAVDHLNSSYVGVYWPWLQDYDADNKQYIWLPPSAYALTQLVYTDNVADPWYAPAGLARGKVSALDVEYSPTRAERDLLYGDTNIVNPIVKFVGEGIAIWGQKTAQRTRSALDRINVRRLMIYAEKLIARMARGFLFEQHDAANWAAFARQANAILEPIRQRRGLYQYTVVCDSTTNTPDLINQNIMAGKIFVQPVKTIEFIEVEFTINAAGEVEFAE